MLKILLFLELSVIVLFGQTVQDEFTISKYKEKANYSKIYYSTYEPVIQMAKIHKYDKKNNISKKIKEFAINLEPNIYDFTFQNEKIPLFVTSSPNTQKDIALIVPYYTYSAYNSIGGVSLYKPLSMKQSERIIKIFRPFGEVNKFHNPAFNPFEFFEQNFENQYSIINQTDLDKYDLTKYKLIVLYGHDEYWTDSMRNQIKKALNSGVNVLNMSGNTAYKKLITTTDGKMFYTQLAHYYTLQRLLGVHYWNFGYPIERKLKEKDLKNIDLSYIYKQTGLKIDNLKLLNGLKVTDHTHPIFRDTHLSLNEWFGEKIKIVDLEVDGWRLNTLGVPVDVLGYSPKILAEGVGYLVSLNRAGVIVENKIGKGKVLSFASIGWTKGLILKDETITKITKNAVNYLLGKR